MAGIVVGVDGSEGSTRALHWAAEQAKLRKESLHLVAAWEIPPLAYSSGVGIGAIGTSAAIGPETIEALRDLTERRLDEVCDENADALAGLEVTRTVTQDAPAHALLDAAKDADLVVVGTRGLGGFKGLLLGSVSNHVAQHSPCPVVIVPGSVDDH